MLPEILYQVTFALSAFAADLLHWSVLFVFFCSGIYYIFYLMYVQLCLYDTEWCLRKKKKRPWPSSPIVQHTSDTRWQTHQGSQRAGVGTNVMKVHAQCHRLHFFTVFPNITWYHWIAGNKWQQIQHRLSGPDKSTVFCGSPDWSEAKVAPSPCTLHQRFPAGCGSCWKQWEDLRSIAALLKGKRKIVSPEFLFS